jgi:hypothetical protein
MRDIHERRWLKFFSWRPVHMVQTFGGHIDAHLTAIAVSERCGQFLTLSDPPVVAEIRN